MNQFLCIILFWIRGFTRSVNVFKERELSGSVAFLEIFRFFGSTNFDLTDRDFEKKKKHNRDSNENVAKQKI